MMKLADQVIQEAVENVNSRRVECAVIAAAMDQERAGHRSFSAREYFDMMQRRKQAAVHQYVH